MVVARGKMGCSQNVSQTPGFYVTRPSWILPTHGIWTVEDTDALSIQHRYKLAKLAVAPVPFCCSTQPNYCAAALSCLSLKEQDPADISCG